MRPTPRTAALADLLPNGLRVVARRPRAIEQTLDPRLPIAQKPFVARLPAHAELPAERSKRLLVLLGRNHKAHPLIHGAGLPPSHRQGPPRRSVDLSPMSPVYSVTHVPGQDPRDTFSRKGRREKRARQKDVLPSRQPPHLPV